jgi:hypothetical protein
MTLRMRWPPCQSVYRAKEMRCFGAYLVTIWAYHEIGPKSVFGNKPNTLVYTDSWAWAWVASGSQRKPIIAGL